MDNPMDGMKIFGEDIEQVDDKRVCEFIKKKIEEVRSSGSRVTFEGQVMTNIAYLLGFDSVYYDTTSRQFKTVGRAHSYLKRNRIHVNKIISRAQNRLSRLLKSRPKYIVKPNSNDTEDKDAARLSEQVLEMIWEKEKMPARLIDLYMWVQQAGHAYLKVSWDPNLGNLIEDPLTGESEFEGDVRIDVVSPFEIFPDPLAKTLDDCRWVVQAKVRSLQYFRDNYPGIGDQVKEEGAWLLSVQYEQRINNLTVTGPTTGIANQMKDSAIELVYYEKRCKKYPNGRMIICANGVKLEDKELPNGEFPFVKFDDIVIGGKYNSESVITHARPIQDQLNRVISMRAAWTNRLLAGKYLVARGSGLHAEQLNDQSGEVLEYNPVPNAPPPAAMPAPAMPSYAYEEEKTLDAMLDDIFGINEASRGVPPGGVTAAIALSWLSEQDDTRIGIVARRNELALAKTMQLALKSAQKNYITPRVLKIAGQNLEYTVKEFEGQDMRENNDVMVIEGSTLPGSITAKRDFIITLFQQGLFGNPQDPSVSQKVLKMLEFGDVGEVWEDTALDSNQVKRDIDNLEKGFPMEEAHELDNHEIHIREKNRYRKGDKFLTLEPWQQQILLTNIEQHLQFELMAAGVQQPPGLDGGVAPPPPGLEPGGVPTQGGPALDAPPPPEPGLSTTDKVAGQVDELNQQTQDQLNSQLNAGGM